MGAVSEMKEMPERFKKYRNHLVELFKYHDIKRIQDLAKKYKCNEQFKSDWINIWKDIAKEEGGKISITTFGIILGSSLGGVGIAAMGGAIGLPLALILGLGGFIIGTNVDSKKVQIKLPKNLLERLESDAKESGLTISDLIEYLVQQAYTT